MSGSVQALFPWQTQQWQRLSHLRLQDRLPHALLLTGPAGLGKVTFAKVLAQRLLCRADVTTNDFACGQCRECQLFLAGSHPDYFEMTLAEKSKAIKVDQIRELINVLTQKPHHALRQVVVLHPAEVLNTAAANAVLKTLEEPPGDVVFILVANRSDRLPATIRSRCQSIPFVACIDGETIAWLQAQLPTGLSAELLLKIAAGAPLKALQLHDMEYLACRDDLLKYLCSFQQHKMTTVAIASELLKYDLFEVVTILLTLVMDMLRLQLKVSNQYIVNSDSIDTINKLAGVANKVHVQKFIEKVLQMLQLLSNASININPQLLLEDLLLNWKRLCM